MGLNLVLVVHLTNFWCLLTKSITLEILWVLKHNKEITKIKNQTCVSFAFLLGVKRAIGLKSCFGGAFDKDLVFLTKNTTLEIHWALKPKR